MEQYGYTSSRKRTKNSVIEEIGVLTGMLVSSIVKVHSNLLLHLVNVCEYTLELIPSFLSFNSIFLLKQSSPQRAAVDYLFL